MSWLKETETWSSLTPSFHRGDNWALKKEVTCLSLWARPLSCRTKNGPSLSPRPVLFLLTYLMKGGSEVSFPDSGLALRSCLFADHRTHGFPVRALIKNLGDGLHAGRSFSKKNNWLLISEAGAFFVRLEQAKGSKGLWLIMLISTDQKNQAPFRCAKKDFLVMMVGLIKEKWMLCRN